MDDLASCALVHTGGHAQWTFAQTGLAFFAKRGRYSCSLGWRTGPPGYHRAEPSHPQAQICSSVWEMCRAQVRPKLGDLAQRIEVAATWEDLVVPDMQHCNLARDCHACAPAQAGL